MGNRLAAALAALLCLSAPASASDVATWHSDADSNTMSPPNGVPDNVAPSKVHGIIREIMAAVNRWYDKANAITSTGSANSQVLTYSPPVSICVPGEGFVFFPGYTNTGETTLTIGGCSGHIRLGSSELTGGELVAGRVAMVFYDGSSFQLLSGGSGGGGGSPVTVTMSGVSIEIGGVPVTGL